MKCLSKWRDKFRKSRYYLPYLRMQFRLKNPGNVNTDEYQSKQSLETLLGLIDPRLFEADSSRLFQDKMVVKEESRDLTYYSHWLIRTVNAARYEDRNEVLLGGDEVTVTYHAFLKLRVLENTLYYGKVKESINLFKMAVKLYAEIKQSYMDGTRGSRNLNHSIFFSIESEIRSIIRQLIDFQYR